MRLIRCFPLVLLVACGDNHGEDKPPDAKVVDAAPDAPIPLTCGYTEMADTTNDDLFANGTAEASGLNFTAPFMICGKFNNGHYEMNAQRIDVDSYKISVPAMSSALVYLTAPGAEAFDSVILEIYSMTTNLSETGQFVGNFAVASAVLAPGDYVITVISYDATAPAAAVDYKLTVQTDSPTRCAKSTVTPPTYTETLDGATADGNDVIEVRYMGSPRRKLTDNPIDMPEPTGIMVAPNMNYRIAGQNTKPTTTPASWADSFQDRDVYQVTMGGTANQLSVRLNWPGTTSDFDFFVFPMGGIIEQATGWYGRMGEPEYTTLAVVPGMSYWVWVGMDDMSSGQPVDYDVTLCGGMFTPPQ